jgi:hypothetical protein
MALEALQTRAFAGDLASPLSPALPNPVKPARAPVHPAGTLPRPEIVGGLLRDFVPAPVWALDGRPVPVAARTLTDLWQRTRLAGSAPGGVLYLEARAGASLSALLGSNPSAWDERVDLLSRLDGHHAVVVDLLVCHGDPRTERALAGRGTADGRLFRAARDLSEAGVEVNLVLAPLLPGVNDRAAALDELFRRGREAGVADVTATWLDLASGLGGWRGALGALSGPWSRASWLRRVEQERPALLPLYRRLYDAAGNLRPLEAEPLATRFAHFRSLHGFPKSGTGDFGRG